MSELRDEVAAVRCGQCGHDSLDHGEQALCWVPGCPCELSWADALLPFIERKMAEARDAGIRQAMEWLRADYEYGTGPDWRESGCEWIADRYADERKRAEP